MDLDDFIKKIPENNNLSASQLIPYFAYFLLRIKGLDSFSAKDIENCFSESHIKPYTNIPSFLSSKLKGQSSLFIKDKEGKYHLQRKVIQEIEPIIKTNEEAPSPSNNLFPIELLDNTRDYIKKVATQAISCYDFNLFDASLVMIRKLIETLIIELFEIEGIANKIKNDKGHFFYLSDLIDKLESETSWNLTRNTIKSLGDIKKYGDLSAHNRRFNARKPDLDGLKKDLRIVIEELVVLIDFQRKR